MMKLIISGGLVGLTLGLCIWAGDVKGDRATAPRSAPRQRADNRTRGGSSRRPLSLEAARSLESPGATAFDGSEGGDISEQVDFDSRPSVVRKAIVAYVKRCYPQAIPYMLWDENGVSMNASKMGASCSITLTGTGPTVVSVNGEIGFPASLFVSDELVRKGLTQAIRDIKKRTS